MSRSPKMTCLLILLLVQTAALAGSADSLKSILSHTSDKKQQAKITTHIIQHYIRDNELSSAKWFDSVIYYTDKLYIFGKEAGDDTTMMRALALRGDGHLAMDQLEQCDSCFDRAIRLARQYKRPEKLLLYIKKRGSNLRNMNRYYDALEVYKEGLLAAERVKDMHNVARMCGWLAIVYRRVEDFSTSLKMSQRSIRICDSLKAYETLTDNYISLGIMFMSSGDNKEALQYLLAADSLLQKHMDSGFSMKARVNLGNCYRKLGNYDKAIEMYKLYEQYHIAHRKHAPVAVAYNHLGNAYLDKRDYATAEKYFLLSDKFYGTSPERKINTIENYLDMAGMYLKTSQPDKALHYSLQAYKITKETRIALRDQADCVAMVSKAYAATGDHMNAYEYGKAHEALKDSITGQREKQQIADAETKFRMSEKDRELALLANENELHKVKSQKLFMVIGFGILLIGAGAGGYRRSIRKNVQLRRQKQIIDDQLTQLAIASEIKSKFYANISHELRTPVTLLTGMLEMLKCEPQDNTRIANKLDIAYTNSRKLQSMIEDILNLSRMERHDTPLQKEIVAAAPLLRRIVFAFESFIVKNGLRLQYSDEGLKSVFFSIDEDKFEKIMNNLVFNAIKFNKENGTVSVKAYLSPDEQYINIEVRDTGKGMSEKDLPRIFERFYQASSSGKQAEGLGIGLSLVKEFTGLLGGTVAVSSIQGEGSTFFLRFPASPSAAPATLPGENAMDTKESWEEFKVRQTVLLVEDNSEMRYYLTEVLGGEVNIAEAANGKLALQWLEKNTPDLIISDIMMPEMDGHEFVAAVKQDDRYKKIPVIMLTALADSTSQLGVLRLGVDDYITKPFNADELRIRAYNLLSKAVARKEFDTLPAEPGDIVEGSKDADEFRQKVTDFVSKQLKNTNVSVFDLAYELAMSERRLYRTAKLLTGCTPAQLIKEVKLQKAYELLLAGDVHKVDDIARRVGYEKASYFSQQFYERFGKRPSEFF
ncbi:MAG: response regulator [Bacteroidota bacterium]